MDKNSLQFVSDIPAEAGGMLIGHCVDNGELVCISDSALSRHMLFDATIGVGVRNAIDIVLHDQIKRGGGLLFVDSKSTPQDLKSIRALCASYGREDDLFVFNPRDPMDSSKMNLIFDGTPSEIASRIMALAPFSENNPGADYYRSASNQGLFSIIRAFQSCDLKFTFMDISICLQNATAMEDLLEKVKAAKGETSSEYRCFALFLDQFRRPCKPGGESLLDMTKIKDVFGGLTARMYLFASGNIGKLVNTTEPDIRLIDAILQNKIIYAALPGLDDPDAAEAARKMLMLEIGACVRMIYEMPVEQHPSGRFLCITDSVEGNYVRTLSDICQQGLGAKIAMVMVSNDLDYLSRVSGDQFNAIMSNVWCKVFMRPTSDESADLAVKVIGSDRVTAGTLKALGLGEAIVCIINRDLDHDLFHVKMPWVSVD